MRASRPAVLLALALVAALATWGLLRAFYSSLPPLPWTAVPTLLLLALGEIVTGVHLRNRIHHKAAAEEARPVDPLSVAHMAVLAKSTAHAAAALTGVFVGFALRVLPDLDLPTPRHDLIVSAATAVSALVLTGAALFLEYCCRVPKDPEEEQNNRRR